ncbi:MAG TPA: hypothetical protein VLA00_15875 [Xanthobacteraceae bacterium]|nr:hypothetical protein [Xanthobacteraceae bacterium]
MFEKTEDSSRKEDHELSQGEFLERLEGYRRSNELYLAQLAEYAAEADEDAGESGHDQPGDGLDDPDEDPDGLDEDPDGGVLN